MLTYQLMRSLTQRCLWNRNTERGHEEAEVVFFFLIEALKFAIDLITFHVICSKQWKYPLIK